MACRTPYKQKFDTYQEAWNAIVKTRQYYTRTGKKKHKSRNPHSIKKLKLAPYRCADHYHLSGTEE